MKRKNSAYRFVKAVFDVTYNSSGKISEKDYLQVIGSNRFNLTSEDLESLAEYLLTNDMVKSAVGEQYKQEVMRKVQNPNSADIKDTKDRTHVNKDKFQKSKKKDDKSEVIAPDNQATASFHLNEVIKSMSEYEDEFLPAWKKFKASGDKASSLEILALFNKFGQDFSNYDQAQRSVLNLLDSSYNQIPEGAVFDNPTLMSMFVKVDPNNSMPIIQKIQNVISRIYDPSALRDIFNELFSALQSGDFKTENVEQDQPAQQPLEQSQEFVLQDDSTTSLDLDTADRSTGFTYASQKSLHRKQAAAPLAMTTVSVGDNAFTVLVAEDAMAKAAGLEVVDSLDDGEGMLFPFYPQQSVTFHMGAVDFPIDILFLMEDGNDLVIGDIVENAKPGSDDKWTAKAKYVLELRGGISSELSLCKGMSCTVDSE